MIEKQSTQLSPVEILIKWLDDEKMGPGQLIFIYNAIGMAYENNSMTGVEIAKLQKIYFYRSIDMGVKFGEDKS